jgi:hypothetical protein
MPTARLVPLARTLVVVLGCLLAPASQAGWLIEDANGDQTLVSRGRLKMDPRDARGQFMVLDLTRARMWVADAGRRLYWEGTVEEYCQAIRGLMRPPRTPPPGGAAGAPGSTGSSSTASSTRSSGSPPTRRWFAT